MRNQAVVQIVGASMLALSPVNLGLLGPARAVVAIGPDSRSPASSEPACRGDVNALRLPGDAGCYCIPDMYATTCTAYNWRYICDAD